jgi:hypothetical protein
MASGLQSNPASDSAAARSDSYSGELANRA